MLMDAPKSPAPLMVVPRPLWTWTPETRAVMEGMFTQKTSWDSASLRVIPLSVTLIWEPLLPRIVMAEFPRPVPPSLYVTTDGRSSRAIGREKDGLEALRASFPTSVWVTGVLSPAREADITTESRRSVISCAPAQRGSTTSAAAKSSSFFISLRRYEPYQVMRV